MRVTVAGGGLAGLTTALRAVELGARTTLLEKGDLLGGSFLLSSGYAWSYRDLRTFRREAPGGDPGLQGLVLERLEPYIDWLERRGCPVLSRETGNPLTFGARLDPEGTVGALARRIADLGGEILPNTALDGLLKDTAGRVTGTRTTRGDELAADAVVLASGGFAGNPELVGRHIIRGPGEMRLRAHPGSTGDGFLAAQAVGARVTGGLDEFYGRNLPAPPAEFSPAEFVEVSQLYGRHAVAINTRGERYADEGADWSETALTRATARQPGLLTWYVLDAAGLENRIRERTAGEMVETARRAGGTVLEAPNLERLADALAEHGLPRDTTLRTLREFNAAVAGGRGDDLTPPRTGQAAPLHVPPFVAVKVAPTITHTVGGLAVDRHCNVLRLEGEEPIPGLYAAGVEVGGVSTGGYTSGLASAIVFGRVAAESSLAR